MKSLLPVRVLYAVAAAYDGLLGLAFLVAAPAVFKLVDMTPPSHWGYVHFAAGLLVVFGLMFLAIARRPLANRNLVAFGILFKVCYVVTVVWHWTHGDIPALWKYFAAADVVFGVLFVVSLQRLREAGQAA